MAAIQDLQMWGGVLPDTDEALQRLLDEIKSRAGTDDEKLEMTDDEGEFDMPPCPHGNARKWSCPYSFVLDVSEHYFLEIGQMWHEGRSLDDDDNRVLSAVFRDKRNPGPGLTPYKWTERDVKGLRELLRWARDNANQLRTTGPCQCGRLALIGTKFCAKHCLQCIVKP